MTDSVPSVSPVEIGVATGFLGAGVGYLAAPRKYNLEDILTQKPDVFEKSVPKNLLVSDAEKNAFDVIVKARKQLRMAVSKNTGETVLEELVKDKNNKEAYKQIKSLIPKTRTQTAIIVGILSGITAVLIRYLTDPRS